MTLYYLDTSIWLDYYEKRGINGKHARNLIMKIITEDSIILYSDLHIKELKGLGYGVDEIGAIFKIGKPNSLRRVHISREQIIEAARLAAWKKVPERDALHAILARDNESIMVATDKHFLQLSTVVNMQSPEEL